jgi:hypothetical protein
MEILLHNWITLALGVILFCGGWVFATRYSCAHPGRKFWTGWTADEIRGEIGVSGLLLFVLTPFTSTLISVWLGYTMGITGICLAVWAVLYSNIDAARLDSGSIPIGHMRRRSARVA